MKSFDTLENWHEEFLKQVLINAFLDSFTFYLQQSLSPRQSDSLCVRLSIRIISVGNDSSEKEKQIILIWKQYVLF